MCTDPAATASRVVAVAESGPFWKVVCPEWGHILLLYLSHASSSLPLQSCEAISPRTKRGIGWRPPHLHVHLWTFRSSHANVSATCTLYAQLGKIRWIFTITLFRMPRHMGHFQHRSRARRWRSSQVPRAGSLGCSQELLLLQCLKALPTSTSCSFCYWGLCCLGIFPWKLTYVAQWQGPQGFEAPKS